MNYKRIFQFVILLVITVFQLFAQQTGIQFIRNYTPEKYKANQQLWAALDYSFSLNQCNLLFLYWLINTDTICSAWNTDYLKEFSNLYENRYVFEVKSKNQFQNLVSCQVNIVKVLNFDNLHKQLITFRIIPHNIIDTTLGCVASYSFLILPPRYRTGWACILFLITFFIIIVLIIKIYTRRLIQQKKYLEQVVKERTHEIVEKNEILQW
jgi:hypothetical protein